MRSFAPPPITTRSEWTIVFGESLRSVRFANPKSLVSIVRRRVLTRIAQPGPSSVAQPDGTPIVARRDERAILGQRCRMVPLGEIAGDVRSRVSRALRAARLRRLDRASGKVQPGHSQSPFPLRWINDHTLGVDDLTFTLRTWDFENLVSRGRDFLLLKDRAFVDEYVRLFSGESVTRVLSVASTTVAICF